MVRKNLESLLVQLGIRIDRNMQADWRSVLHDKKIIGDKILFPIIKKEGRTKLVTLNSNVLKKFLK